MIKIRLLVVNRFQIVIRIWFKIVLFKKMNLTLNQLSSNHLHLYFNLVKFNKMHKKAKAKAKQQTNLNLSSYLKDLEGVYIIVRIRLHNLNFQVMKMMKKKHLSLKMIKIMSFLRIIILIQLVKMCILELSKIIRVLVSNPFEIQKQWIIADFYGF